MNNKKVLITGLNYNQLPYVKEIKKLGYRIIGIDKNPDAPAKALCDAFYNFGYNEVSKIKDICEREKFTSNDLFFTASLQESYLYLSEVAPIFRIKFPPINSVKIVLDKIELYSFFKKIGIPFPKTYYIYSSKDLEYFCKKTKNFSKKRIYYLKSDFSKNPKYVYRIHLDNFNPNGVQWKPDRYLRRGYVLQEEFMGIGIRVNVFDNWFTAYDFEVKDVPIPINKEILEKVREMNIFKVLKYISTQLNLESYLIKYDIIVDFRQNKFAVLDIGMDPPYRMRKHYENTGLNFPKMYVLHYLEGINNYTFKIPIG